MTRLGTQDSGNLADDNERRERRLARTTEILALAVAAEASIISLIEAVKEVYRNELFE